MHSCRFSNCVIIGVVNQCSMGLVLNRITLMLPEQSAPNYDLRTQNILGGERQSKSPGLRGS